VKASVRDRRHRELVERAYERYGHSVLRRARQILGHETDAQDALQEVFMALMQRPEQFEGRSELGSYLYSATTHLCLNRLRNQRNRERLRGSLAPVLEPGVPTAAPDSAAQLREVLAVLSDEEARIAVFHHLDGMTHAEIGAFLQCSRRRIGDVLERVRDRFKDAPEQHVGGVA
jgi:RNA polymerase sigma factor (sigma-70 family)